MQGGILDPGSLGDLEPISMYCSEYIFLQVGNAGVWAAVNSHLKVI